jgi:hypothetical protein
VLLDLLQFKTDDKSDLALERQSDYRRAIARLDPPRATDHGRVAARQLRRDASFRLAVINEFLPAHANDAARAAAIIQAVPVYETGTVGSWVALVTALTAALAVPIVVLIRGRR